MKAIKSFTPEFTGPQPFDGSHHLVISEVSSGSLPTLLDLLEKLELLEVTSVEKTCEPPEELQKVYRREILEKNSDERSWNSVVKHVNEGQVDLGLTIGADEDGEEFVQGDMGLAFALVKQQGIKTLGFSMMRKIIQEKTEDLENQETPQ